MSNKFGKFGVIITPHCYFVVLMLLLNSSIDFMDVKGILILSMVIVNPILLFLQGLHSVRCGVSPYISIGFSLLSILVYMYLFMNSSAYIHLLVYLVFAIIGVEVGKRLYKTNQNTSKL